MHRSESIAKVAEALAAAQGEFPAIPRDRTVTVQPKPKRKPDGSEYWPQPYSFTYAPLDTILGCVRPALAKHALALSQAVVADEKGTEFLRTTLLHSSGEWLSNDIPVFTSGADNASQAYGSGLTYARRYGVTALLCIAADEDDDAGGTDGEGETKRAQRQAPAGGKPAGQGKGAGKPAASAYQDGEPGIHLSESQKRLLLAKAKAAGLEHEEGTEAALVQKFNRIDAKNINEVLAALGAMREQGEA